MRMLGTTAMFPNSWWVNVSDGLGNLLFVDTEFTDLRNQFLISLGATTYSGCEFYAESSDYQTEQCSPFVKRTVLPLLRGTEFAESELQIGERFVAWIESLHGPCRLVFDYVGDFEIIVRLFTCVGRWPSNLYRVAYEVALPYSMCDQGTGFGSNFSARQIAKVEKSIAEHFQAFPRHHALHDALAMKLAWSLYSQQPRMGSKMLDKCVVASHKCPSLFRDQQYSPLSAG
jgi:hypothetical protein